MARTTQLLEKRISIWMLFSVSTSLTGCLNTTASCVERDYPDNTCYSWPDVSSEGCTKVPGCSIRPMCVAISCHSDAELDGGVVVRDSGTGQLCVLSDHVACAQLPIEQCGLNTKCMVANDCGGTPTVNCAAIKRDVECMAYPVCFWQVSGT